MRKREISKCELKCENSLSSPRFRISNFAFRISLFFRVAQTEEQ